MFLQKENNSNVCEFCKKSFTNYNNLKVHQKTAKFCLQIQNKPIDDNYVCEHCNKNFNLKKVFNNHIAICKDKKAFEEKEQNDKLIERIKELENELKEKDKELNKKDILISELKVKVSSKDEIIKKLEKTNKELLKRPTTTSTSIVNNNDNRQQNQYNIQFNQLFEKLPILNEENVNNKLNELTTEEKVNEYHFDNFYIEALEKMAYQLKDFSFCTDASRKIVVIKDKNEKSVKMNAEEFLSICFKYGSESILNHITFTDKIVDDKVNNFDRDLTSEMLDIFNEDRDKFKNRIKSNKDNFFLTNNQNDNKVESTVVLNCVKQLEKCSK
jgi:hypothetical protein